MEEFDLDITFWDVAVEFMLNGLYVYTVIIMSSYLVLAAISFINVRKYLRKNFYTEYEDLLNTPISVPVSILAPAYNEGNTIIDNIKSLLAVRYAKFEVIVVNDGSTDDTLERCIKEFDMVKTDWAYFQKVPTKKVRAVYKSTNSAYSSLVLIDKENGGKSDALNAAINVAAYDFVMCIDVDCVLEQDALLKLMKPFLEERDDTEVIATGGVVRIANDCVVENGMLKEVRVPKNYVARAQVLEYIRAFLLGRMAWSLMDGLLLISGALGVFRKDRVIEVGGYDTGTVGEDMELVVRMRRHMVELKKKYTVAFVPDPLCWTEAPQKWSILGRQRNRWTRGTIETLWKHRRLMFNPKYKIVGLMSYPYWAFFEWFAPILEALGIMIFFLFVLAGLVNWTFFILMMFVIYGFTLAFSVLALLVEEITYHQYKRRRDVFKLLRTGIIEPLIFHPFNVYNAVRGNLDYWMGKSSWGKMARVGFADKKKKDKPSKRIIVASSSVAAAPVTLVKKQPMTLIYISIVIVTLVFGVFLYYQINPPGKYERAIARGGVTSDNWREKSEERGTSLFAYLDSVDIKKAVKFGVFGMADTTYYMIVGSYTDERWAREYESTLDEMDYHADVLESDDGKFRVYVNKAYERDEALKMREQYQAINPELFKGMWIKRTWEEE